MRGDQTLAETAQRMKDLGVPDHLNKWLRLAAQAGRGQPKAEAGRELTRAAAEAAAQSIAAAAAQTEESDMRKPRRNTARGRIKSPTRAKRGSTPAKVDRRPSKVGDFIVAGGNEGVEMRAIEKEFKMKAHPLRAKIFAARHELGYSIEYVAMTKRYVGKAPTRAAA